MNWPYAYNKYFRKNIVAFSNIFSNLYTSTTDKDGQQIRVRCPIKYAPKEKFIQRILDKTSISEGTKVEITLPIMSYIETSIGIDGSRRFNKTSEFRCIDEEGGAEIVLSPLPVNMVFNLFCYARNKTHLLQLAEQIMPRFNPEMVIKMNFNDQMQNVTVPVTMATGIIINHKYDGTFKDRRVIISSVAFTMKTWVFLPKFDGDIITDVNVDVDLDE